MKHADVLRKIRSLFARADENRNDNENERATALRMANKMMDAHGVSVLELGDDDDLGERGRSQTNTGSKRWQTRVYYALSQLYGCQCYYSSGKNGMTSIIGREHYRNVVLDLGAWVVKSIEAEAKDYSVYGRAYTNAFKVGAASSVWASASDIIKERLNRETLKAASVPGTALVLVDHYKSELVLNKTWMDNDGIRTRHGARSSFSDASAYRDGQAYGKGISLNGQLGGTKRPSGLLR